MQRLFRYVDGNLSTPKRFLIFTFVVYCIFLLPLTVLVYHWQFIADDLTLLHAAQKNPFPLTGDWINSIAGLYRPLVILSFFLNFKLCGYSPFSFYVVNFILHLIATSSVALLGRNLFWHSQLPYSNVYGFLLGLVFLISPQNLQNILWISGRTDLLCGMFLFISLLMFIDYIESSKKVFFALFVLFQGAAFMSKETAAITSFYALLIIFVYAPNGKSVFAMKTLVLPVAMTAVYLLFRTIILRGSTFVQLGDMSFGIMKMFKFALYGIWTMVIPIDLLDVISLSEVNRFVVIIIVMGIIIILAVILSYIVRNRGNNLKIGLLSVAIGFASLVIYMLNYPQMRLMYMHYPFILIGFVYLMMAGRPQRFLAISIVFIFTCFMLVGVFNIVSRSIKINNYTRELFRALPDSDEYQSQKQYILLSALGRIGQSYAVPNIQHMASLKMRGDLEEMNRSFSMVCYYETDSFDPLGRTADFHFVGPNTIEATASQKGSILVPSTSKKFNVNDPSYYSEMTKNIKIIPTEMDSLRQGGANSCEIIFNDKILWDSVEILTYENNKFTRTPLRSFILDLQGKSNR